MRNELLLKQAIELLQGVNPDEVETVQIDNTKYDDGSIGFNVCLTYPTKEETIVEYSDGMDTLTKHIRKGE